ncbi:hypothetical protein FVEN_g13091 [Fusarium venenatum]|nr:hypothetical protein FVEN_g13091 [Fusarium venenatum]
MSELYVVRNVYNLTIKATIAISSNACKGISGLVEMPDFVPGKQSSGHQKN